MTYEFLTPNEHIITVRDRVTNMAKQHRYWNNNVISKILKNQSENEDIYISKYPKGRCIDTIILDFDSEDIKEAYKDVKRMSNYLKKNGLNTVIVKSGSKGYHAYIEIAPFLFNDTNIRRVSDWNKFFNAFVCFLIHDGESSYSTLDPINFSAGLNGNIRLIGSVHPKTHEKCEIIEGEFLKEYKVTQIQDSAQRTAYAKMEIKKQDKERQLKTAIIDGNDPITNNDLREVFRELTGDIKIYPKGYGYCCCPFHNDTNPSMLVTKEWYSCSGCKEKGNIWTLKKKGLVRFDENGKVN